jgi:hypothetical protein
MQAQSNNSQLAVVKPAQSTAVVTKTPSLINNLDDIARVSELLAKSGFFEDAKTAAQCGVKVLAGLEMGFKAFQSMTGIHIIKGKPTVGAGLMAAKIRGSGKYDYEVLEQSDSICRIAIFEAIFKQDVVDLKRQLIRGVVDKARYDAAIEVIALGVSVFTKEDAQKAGTQNMGKFPKNMLFARCVSNAVKFHCPDVFDCSVYVPEEMGVEVDDDGNILSYEPYSPKEKEFQKLIEQQPTQPKPQPQQPSEIDQLRMQLKSTVESKGWVLNDVAPWIKEQCQTRYNKPNTSACTPEELRDLIQFIASYEPPQQEPVDVDIDFDNTL